MNILSNQRLNAFLKCRTIKILGKRFCIVFRILTSTCLLQPPIFPLFAKSTTPLLSISMIIGSFTLSPIVFRTFWTYIMSWAYKFNTPAVCSASQTDSVTDFYIELLNITGAPSNSTLYPEVHFCLSCLRILCVVGSHFNHWGQTHGPCSHSTFTLDSEQGLYHLCHRNTSLSSTLSNSALALQVSIISSNHEQHCVCLAMNTASCAYPSPHQNNAVPVSLVWKSLHLRQVFVEQFQVLTATLSQTSGMASTHRYALANGSHIYCNQEGQF